MKSIGIIRSYLLYCLLVMPLINSEFSCVLQQPVGIDISDRSYKSKPFVNGATKFIGGDMVPFEGQVDDVTSAIIDKSTGERLVIGKLAQFTPADAIEAVER